MSEEKPWTVTVDTVAMKADPQTAGYFLRLGIAITAIRAAHRLTVAVEDIKGPSQPGTRLWAFLLAVAYLHETAVTAQSQYPKLRKFALAAGATQGLLDAVGQTFAGKTAVGAAMARIRNSLVFHFDQPAAEAWIKEFDKPTVVWAEGLGPKVGNTLYRASSDVAASNILPGEDDAEKRQQLMADVLTETEQILRLLEHALAGYMNSIGGTLTHSS
jgi:hypothetical protein